MDQKKKKIDIWTIIIRNYIIFLFLGSTYDASTHCWCWWTLLKDGRLCVLVLGSAAATDSVAAVVEVDVQWWHNQHNIPEWSFPAQNNQIYPGTAETWIQHLYSYKYWVNKTGYMVDKCPNYDSSHTTSQLFNFQSDQPHSQGSMGKTCKNCQISNSGNICWWSQLEEPKLQNERCISPEKQNH